MANRHRWRNCVMAAGGLLLAATAGAQTIPLWLGVASEEVSDKLIFWQRQSLPGGRSLYIAALAMVGNVDVKAHFPEAHFPKAHFPERPTRPSDDREFRPHFFRDDTLWCAGSLVGQPARFVTAAHCLAGASQARIRIAGTLHDMNCRSHPRYRTEGDSHDIAVCTLPSGVTLPFTPPAVGTLPDAWQTDRVRAFMRAGCEGDALTPGRLYPVGPMAFAGEVDPTPARAAGDPAHLLSVSVAVHDGYEFCPHDSGSAIYHRGDIVAVAHRLDGDSTVVAVPLYRADVACLLDPACTPAR